MKNATRGFTFQKKEKFLRYGASVDSQLCDNIQLNYLLEQLELATTKIEKEIICNDIKQIITYTMLKEDHKYKSWPKIIAQLPIYAWHKSAYRLTRNQLQHFRTNGTTTATLPTGITTTEDILKYLKQQLKQASSALKEIEKASISHQMKFLQQKLHLAHEENDKDRIKALWNIYQGRLENMHFKKLPQ